MPQGAGHTYSVTHCHAHAAHCNADGCSRVDVQRADLPDGDTPASHRNTDVYAYASPHGDTHPTTYCNAYCDRNAAPYAYASTYGDAYPAPASDCYTHTASYGNIHVSSRSRTST